MTDDLDARRAGLAARRAAAPTGRRGHAAAGGRWLAAGLSTGAALVLTGALARAHPAEPSPAPAPAVASAPSPTTAPAPFLDRLATTPPATAAPTPPVVAAAPALPPATTSRAS